jgi:ligand-binding sensor domain-containing protein
MLVSYLGVEIRRRSLQTLSLASISENVWVVSVRRGICSLLAES